MLHYGYNENESKHIKIYESILKYIQIYYISNDLISQKIVF